MTLFNALQHNRRVSTIGRLGKSGIGGECSEQQQRALPVLEGIEDCLSVIALAVLSMPGEAAAQAAASEDAASLQAQKDALFQRMLRDPANLDVTFKYADVAARLGDYEAAVSALERMLLFNPDLPRVQLELGVLYFRMGSYGLARDYFDRAAAANPPPEIRGRLDQYMAEIEKGEPRHRLSGYFFSGVQYQTNANVAGSSVILSPIGPVLLNNQFTKQASGSIFGSGSVLYSYDLQTQSRDTLDVTGANISTIISILCGTGSTSPCPK
jgi:tetratricopeptide (TPR) repeat protein